MAFAQSADRDRLIEAGRQLRTRMPVEELATHVARDGETAVKLVLEANRGRVEELVPLRLARMATGPFAFLRGSAGVMAHDLEAGPASTGLLAQICGDAHISNFGFFASPERRLVMDVNDFDETLVGPFEYDVKRLAASIVVAAREYGFGEDAATDAVGDAMLTYAEVTRALAKMPVINAWTAEFNPRAVRKLKLGHLESVLRSVAEKALANDSARVANKMTATTDEHWHFVDKPPILRRLHGDEREAVRAGLIGYAGTVMSTRAVLLSRYHLADLAFRVVGVGSVGTRAYIALLHGTNDDPLVLQIKEARPSVFAGSPRCHVAVGGGDGNRVVHGQRTMQTFSDPMLGWTQVEGRDAFVRMFRDLKGSIDVADLQPRQLDGYARVCGALLARAHARSLDPHVLRGYLGKGRKLAAAMVRYATAYADQTERDFEAFTAAIKAGRVRVADDPLT